MLCQIVGVLGFFTSTKLSVMCGPCYHGLVYKKEVQHAKMVMEWLRMTTMVKNFSCTGETKDLSGTLSPTCLTSVKVSHSATRGNKTKNFALSHAQWSGHLLKFLAQYHQTLLTKIPWQRSAMRKPFYWCPIILLTLSTFYSLKLWYGCCSSSLDRLLHAASF